MRSYFDRTILARCRWGTDSEVGLQLRLGGPAVVGFAFDSALPDSGAAGLRFLHHPATSAVSGQLAVALDRPSAVPGTLSVLAGSSDPPPKRGYFSKSGTYELRAVKEGQRLRLFCGKYCLAEAGLSARDALAVANSRIRVVLVPAGTDALLNANLRQIRIGPPGPTAEPAGGGER